MAPFRIVPLDKRDRSSFNCGVVALNGYFRQRVSQDVRRSVTTCFIATEIATDTIAGYYTLSAGSVVLTDLPEMILKKLPRYPVVPVAVIGRLAVDTNFQGRGLGSALLFDAMERAIQTELGVWAIVVDAKDDSAVRFYEQYGFQCIASDSQRLFLPLSEKHRLLTDHQ